MADCFTYLDFSVADDNQTVHFNYGITRGNQNSQLDETLKFPVRLKASASQQASLRALHLALGISYYKIFASPLIEQPYKMDEAEANFWNDVFRNGLGEFCYVNKLNPDDLAKFSAQDGRVFEKVEAGTENSGALLGLGGGKDSALAGELLKELGIETSGFVMATGEQLGQTKAVAEKMGVELLAIERRLDKQLLELQEMPGSLKGHVPISLIFGLVGVALAVARGKSYVVVGNEASASIPRINSNYGAVNHQWSKSLTLEKSLQAFIHTSISSGVSYFSAIRQLSSVAVAKLFADHPKYFEVFTSDNSVFRIDPGKRPSGRWSLDSPKSLSSFILLSAWLDEPELLKIFGRNFLNEASLEELFLELVGEVGTPPLDCVGTTDELVLSLNLAASQKKFANSYLMELAVGRGIIKSEDWPSELAKMLAIGRDQALPPELADKITSYLKSELAK